MSVLRIMMLLSATVLSGCNDMHSLNHIDLKKSSVTIYREGCEYAELKATELPLGVVDKMRDIVTSFPYGYSIDIATYVPNIMVYENNTKTTINFIEDAVVVNIDGGQYSRTYGPIDISLYSEIVKALETVSLSNSVQQITK